MKKTKVDNLKIPAHVSKIGSNTYIWGTTSASTSSPIAMKKPFLFGHKRKKKKTSANGWQKQAMKRAHSNHDNLSDNSITPDSSPPPSNSQSDTISDSSIYSNASSPSSSRQPTPSPSNETSNETATTTMESKTNKNTTNKTNFNTQTDPTDSTDPTDHSNNSTASINTPTSIATTTNASTTTATNFPIIQTKPIFIDPPLRDKYSENKSKRSSRKSKSKSKSKSKPKSKSSTNSSTKSASKSKHHRKGLRQKSPRQWERVLWKRQTVPDNYVPDTWLHSVNRRSNTYEQGYWTMVKHTAVLMQQLCIVVIFSTVFRLALTEDTEIIKGAAPSISLSHLLLIDFAVVIFFYIFHFILSKQITNVPHSSAAHVLFMQPHRIVLFLVILMAVSPVLHTLTKAYASDTIYILALSLGAVHIFFYDFTYILSMHRDFNCTISSNAALLTAVLLASRLSSNLHCFALMCFALELFTLSPILRHLMREYSERLHIIFTICLVFVVGIILSVTHELFFSALWLAASTVLPFYAPFYLSKRNGINLFCGVHGI